MYKIIAIVLALSACTTNETYGNLHVQEGPCSEEIKAPGGVVIQAVNIRSFDYQESYEVYGWGIEDGILTLPQCDDYYRLVYVK